MTVKRLLEADTEIENMAMANCLMLLSRVGKSAEPRRLFHCKTCNKPFQSFQALGGHRASHKRSKLTDDGGRSQSPPKPKTHECSICGQEFAIGQALGGHMRRHRDDVTGKTIRTAAPVKKGSGMRGLFLDLNLTPYENDLKLWAIVVLACNSEIVLLPMNEPVYGTKRKIQIQTYLEHNEGVGVHQLALTSEDIFRTLREMRKRNEVGGFEFMSSSSPTYYRNLKKRADDVLSGERSTECEEIGDIGFEFMSSPPCLIIQAPNGRVMWVWNGSKGFLEGGFLQKA
ncbi:hypothetical protein L6452_42712 [Arctium lappa]|uniref:Uncharacterized protein n=1 Tax=Arctium lappa TaxID=4217 RepID=A0ACB8XJ07_ARCLA|nr:hypothetical protein L6452_42712 [Arctium lappa]